jgi:hypothetical protein
MGGNFQKLSQHIGHFWDSHIEFAPITKDDTEFFEQTLADWLQRDRNTQIKNLMESYFRYCFGLSQSHPEHLNGRAVILHRNSDPEATGPQSSEKVGFTFWHQNPVTEAATFHGFMGVKKLKANIGGVNMDRNQDLPSLSEFMLYSLCTHLHKSGIRAFHIGGSETKSLRDFYKKFRPAPGPLFPGNQNKGIEKLYTLDVRHPTLSLPFAGS